MISEIHIHNLLIIIWKNWLIKWKSCLLKYLGNQVSIETCQFPLLSSPQSQIGFYNEINMISFILWLFELEINQRFYE